MIIFYLFIYLCWSLSKLFQRWSFEPLFQAVDGWIGWRTGDRWKCDSLDDFWINCSAGEEEPAAALEQTNKQTNKALSERDGHVCSVHHQARYYPHSEPSSSVVMSLDRDCTHVIGWCHHPPCPWCQLSPTTHSITLAITYCCCTIPCIHHCELFMHPPLKTRLGDVWYAYFHSIVDVSALEIFKFSISLVWYLNHTTINKFPS